MFLGCNLRFFSVYQDFIIKTDENRLEILFLLTYHTQAKDIAVVKRGTRNDFQSSCLYDTLNRRHIYRNQMSNSAGQRMELYSLSSPLQVSQGMINM